MEELVDLAYSSVLKLRAHLKKENTEILELLEKFQAENNLSWAQAVYHFLQGDLDLSQGVCLECSERTSFRSLREGYKTYCSKTCANIASKTKRFKSLEQNWGVKHPNQHPKIREKIKQTNLERWGKENFAQSSEFKKRVQKTSQERWGVDHYKQAPSVKEKYRKTCKSRWGKDTPLRHPLIRARIEQTLIERYGSSNSRYCHIDSEVREYMHLRSWWEDLYLTEGLTPKEIVEETGLSLSFVYKQLQYFGLLGGDQSQGEPNHPGRFDSSDLFKPII